MKRAVVSDLTSPKYSILTTEDLVPNNVLNPKVTKKLAQPKKPRKTVKRKENIYTIHSGEIQVIKEKRTYRKKKKAEEETKSLLRQNLQNYLNYQPNLPRSLITGARGFGGVSQAFSDSSAAICSTTLPQQTETLNLDLNSNEKCPKALGGYRKIHFGNYNVISTGEPTQDHNRVFETIIIDDNADFDIFQPPHLKSLPEDIFEPVVIKQEDDESIINKDVLINSDSNSVVFSLDHGKRRYKEAELDDRVETLRDINATAQVRGEGDKQAKKRARDKELSAQKNLLDSLDKQIQLLENIVYGPSAETTATAQNNVEAQENPTLKTGDDPFANTFGTPDEVIISETVELEDIKHPVGLGESQEPKTEVIEEEIRGQIRRIITSEEADKGKAGTLVEDTKKKIQTLQSIILYFNEVISSEKQQIIKVGFIKTLIDSTLELFTIPQKPDVNKKKSRKTKSKQCQKIRKLPLKKLQGSNDITMKNTPNQQEIDEESLKQLTSKLSEETNVNNNESFQSPFIFSDIEEVAEVPLRKTAKTASSPTETNEFKYENPHSHVKADILKTYSRKLGKNPNSEFVNTKLTVKLVKCAETYQNGETKDKMVAGERKIKNEIHSADVPVQPKKTKRLNTDELMNVVPERRTSERIKKRPNFYGLGIYWK